MKKYLNLFIFFVVLGLMLSTSVVKAEDNNILKDRREDFRNEMKVNREAFREKIQAERKTFTDDLKTKRNAFMAEIKTKKKKFKTARTEVKKRFCEKAREMAAKRFEFAITQLEKFQTRVGEIIAKLEADSKDTTLATESLNLSKQKLEDAKVKLSEIKGLIPEGGCENMTPEIFEKIKLLAREAKDLLKESREALRQAIKEIKSLREEDESSNL